MIRFVLSSFFIAASVLAQNSTPVPESIVTTATTKLDPSGRPWAYLKWSAANPSVLKGARLAVYGRAGGADAGGGFARLGVAQSTTDTTVIQVRLTQAQALGDDVARLNDVLTELLSPANWNGPVNGTLAEKISATLVRANGDAASAETVQLATLGFPSMALVTGAAWAQALPVPVGQPYTFEVRVAHPTDPAQDGPVLSRLTINAGQPTAMPAPGAPVQVCDVSPKGNLAVKLLWPVPTALRRVSLLSHGFNIYRVPQASLGNVGGNPTATTLRSGVAAGWAKKVNATPILITEAPQFPVGPTDGSAPYYFADDNGVASDGGVAFTEGDAFAYFVVARDLLGTEGAVSAAGMGVAVATLPPAVPADLKVEEVTDDDGFSRHLRVSFTQNPTAQPNRTDEYWLYHGITTNPAPAQVPLSVLEQWNADQATSDAFAACRFQVLPHLPGETKRMVLDLTLPDAPELANQSLWFAIRAVHQGPAGCVVATAPSPPSFGLLRTHEGPPAPTGAAATSAPRVAIRGVGLALVAGETLPDTGVNHFRVKCTRRSPEIGWVHFAIARHVLAEPTLPPIGDWEILQDLGRTWFAEGQDVETQDFTLVEGYDPELQMIVCYTGSEAGVQSHLTRIELSPHFGTTEIMQAEFETTAVSSGDVDPTTWVGRDLLIPSNGDGGAPPKIFELSDVVSDGQSSRVALVADPGFSFQQRMQWEALITADNGARIVGAAMISRSSIYVDFEANFADDAVPASDLGSYRCYLFRDAPVMTAHNPRPAGSDRVHPVHLRLDLLGDNVSEYRLFRSLDDGPMSLIVQDARDFTAQNITTIVAKDTAMPTASGTLRYYAQTADKHGNASPVRLIATVPLMVRPSAPVLGRPQTKLGPNGEAQAVLTWICPPTGVQRFEVHLEPDDLQQGTPGQSGNSQPSAASTLPAQGIHIFTAPVANKAFQTLLDGPLLIPRKLLYQQTFFTPAPGMQDFSAGPEFTCTLNILPQGRYKAWVKAIDLNGAAGPSSAVQSFAWKTPVAPAAETMLPWPARPLPPVAAGPMMNGAGITASALVLPPYPAGSIAYTPQHYLAWPDVDNQACLGVRIGRVSLTTSPLVSEALHENGLNYPAFGNMQSLLPLLIFPTTTAQPLSLVLYRQQVPNTRYPTVSGTTIQCSARIDKILTKHFANANHLAVLDPQIGILRTVVNDMPTADLCLLDAQPQVKGATYRYTLVRFRADGEISHVYPAGEVTLP